METIPVFEPDPKKELLASLKRKTKFFPVIWTIQSYQSPRTPDFFSGTVVRNDFEEMPSKRFILRLYVKNIFRLLPNSKEGEKLKKYENRTITEEGVPIVLPAIGINDWTIIPVNDKRVLIFCPDLYPGNSLETRPSTIFSALIDL